MVHLINFTVCNLRLLPTVGGPVSEEVEPVRDIRLTLAIPPGEGITKVYLVPEGTELESEEKNRRITVIVPKVEIHRMIAFETIK